MSMSLKDAKIMDQWSVMLPGCQGEGPGLIQVVQQKLSSYECQDITWKEESASTGLMKSLMGKRRDVLVVRNEKFSEWMVCMGAQDYGRFLNVVWYLTASPSVMSKFRGGGVVGLATGGGFVLPDLDVFDQQDVSAYVAVTRMAVRAAAEELAEKRQLDIDRLERQAHGLRAK